MNINVGNFKCPKCKEKKIFDFNNWTNRDEIVNNSLVKKWIFYEEKSNNCECCSFYRFHSYSVKKFTLNFFGYVKECCCCIILPFFIIYIVLLGVFALVFYPLVFVWIDLYYCCSKYIIIYQSKKENYIVHIKKGYELWEHKIKGKTLDEYNSLFESEIICKNCNKKFNSFLNFIDFTNLNVIKTKNLEETEIHINTSPNSPLTNGEFITVHFINCLGINTAFTCNKKTKFKKVLEKFCEINEEYKNKNLIFMSGGNSINIEKTIEENRIKDGDKIVVQEKVNSIII